MAAKVGALKPRVVVRMDGGLASQMWQFSLGYTVSRETGLPPYWECSFYATSSKDLLGNVNRKFVLLDTFPKIRSLYGDHFGENADSLFCQIFTDQVDARSYWDFFPDVFKRQPRYLGSYYAHRSYVDRYLPELRDLFEFCLSLSDEEKKWKHDIESDPLACSVHLRKGDFVGSCHDVCSDAYYLGAMKKMEELYPGTTFYVFTNDEMYADRLFGQVPYRVRIIRGRNEVDPRVDMYLLSLFSHSIISNSGFSWFPVFLNSDKADSKVIMPSVWSVIDGKVNDYNTVRNRGGWLVISCATGEEIQV